MLIHSHFYVAISSLPGSHGASKHVQIVAFPTAKQAVLFLKEEYQCQSFVGLLGCVPTDNKHGCLGGSTRADGCRVSIVSSTGNAEVSQDDARSTGDDSDLVTVAVSERGEAITYDGRSDPPSVVTTNSAAAKLPRSFPVFESRFGVDDSNNSKSVAGNICFVVGGRKANGLPLSLARHCDVFVHVPHAAIQPSKPSTTSPPLLLDLQSCLSIVLHHFSQWAKYDEHTFAGHKFEVPTAYNNRSEQEAQQERRREERERQHRLKQIEIEEQEARVEDGAAPETILFLQNDSEGGDY